MSDAITRLNAALEGRYRIERQLGEGGMATVYLADDLRHERKVAVKVLRPELAAVVGADRFLAEIKTTAKLQHPHILPLFDSGEADGFLFYVMPHVEGESLRERLDREHQLPVDKAVRIAMNVAEALDYAHRHGVIHRDIKPANILLQDGKPVVSDFGIALAVTASGANRLTETGLSLGTPHYMSPEQATGDLSVGAATDIYALGCVLYEMLVGEPPYTGSTPQAILGKIIQAEPVSAMKTRRTVPPNVDAAIRKALEKVPADRFMAASELARALSDVGFGHGGVPSAAGAGGAAIMAGPWNRLTVAMTSLGAVFAIIAVWALLRPSPQLPTARFPSPFQSGQAPMGQMEFTPDGSALVYVGPGTAGGSQLWIRSWSVLDATPIRGTEGARSFALSRDGREVAVTASPGPLRVVAIEGGQGRTLVEGVQTVEDWAPDGTIYFMAQYSFGLESIPADAATAEAVEVITDRSEGESFHGELEVLPEGDMGVFQVWHDARGRDAEIWAINLATRERWMLTAGHSPSYAPTGHLLFATADGTLMAAPVGRALVGLSGPAVAVGDVAVLLPYGLSFYATSANGALIYAAAAGANSPGGLVVVDLQGREEPLGFAEQVYAYPRFSPDGGRLAVGVIGSVAEESDLWVLDLDRGSRSRVTFGGVNYFFPVWSPAEDRLTSSDGPYARPNKLFFAAADGSGRMETLLERAGLQYPTSWSSDGRALVYHEANPETGRDLWVLPAGGEPEPFLVTPFNERAGTFSPDARWLAYVSDKSGADEVYVQPYPGPGRETTVSVGGGDEPVWSPDGSELFYRTEGQLMAVAVDARGGFSAGAPTVLFDDLYERDVSASAAVPNYDVALDGEHFVMIKGGRLVAGSAILVQNFFEELKQLAPN